VPQLVRVQPGYADGGGCGVEAAIAEHRYPQRATATHTAEHQLVGFLSSEVRREVLDEEPRDRHLSTLMGLRGAPHQPLTLDHGHRLGDRCPPADEVEPPDAQRRQRSPNRTPSPGVDCLLRDVV
jgi:hypothetical protein